METSGGEHEKPHDFHEWRGFERRLDRNVNITNTTVVVRSRLSIAFATFNFDRCQINFKVGQFEVYRAYLCVIFYAQVRNWF